MKIGIAYDLKESVPVDRVHPEDALEEYDSRQTIDDIAEAIEFLGHTTVRLGGGREFLSKIVQESVDLVFNISEGLGNYRSREAQVPSVLEMLDIPYTGSDPQCLAICLDKPLTKELVTAAGILTPRWQAIANVNELAGMSWDKFPFPAFVKPAYEGSSKGIRLNSRVKDPDELARIVSRIIEEYRQPALVEEFIEGDEVTVGVIGNASPEIVGVMRVLTRDGKAPIAYSLEVKREWESLVEYECPARLEKKILERVREASLKAFRVLGCRDVSRIDFRITPEGEPYFLEVNPLPGLNSHSSDLPIMARKMGISYQSLISSILDAAIARHPLCVHP